MKAENFCLGCISLHYIVYIFILLLPISIFSTHSFHIDFLLLHLSSPLFAFLCVFIFTIHMRTKIDNSPSEIIFVPIPVVAGCSITLVEVLISLPLAMTCSSQ